MNVGLGVIWGEAVRSINTQSMPNQLRIGCREGSSGWAG